MYVYVYIWECHCCIDCTWHSNCYSWQLACMYIPQELMQGHNCSSNLLCESQLCDHVHSFPSHTIYNSIVMGSTANSCGDNKCEYMGVKHHDQHSHDKGLCQRNNHIVDMHVENPKVFLFHISRQNMSCHTVCTLICITHVCRPPQLPHQVLCSSSGHMDTHSVQSE